MKKLITMLALSGSLNGWSRDCELPMKKLVIGCTYKCDFPYRLRLTLSALSMGHSLQIVDLREMGPLDEALAKVDGVLMPGGADIHPDYYTHTAPELKSQAHLANITEEGKERDPFESELLKKYSSDERWAKLPFLGICRGMQMMTVTQGIPLYVDLKTETGIENRKYVFDDVSIQQSSLMSEIYQRPRLRALKLHHQALRVPFYEQNRAKFPLVKVTSFSNGGTIAESIEYTHRPALGVQFHPEMSFTSASAPVFRWFLNKSCEYKTASKGTL